MCIDVYSIDGCIATVATGMDGTTLAVLLFVLLFVGAIAGYVQPSICWKRRSWRHRMKAD